MHTEHEHARYLGRCPMCGLAFAGTHAAVVRRASRAVVVHAQCPRCRSAATLSVIVGSLGVVTTIGMLTDFSRTDITRLRSLRPLTADDVLTTHTSLVRKRTA